MRKRVNLDGKNAICFRNIFLGTRLYFLLRINIAIALIIFSPSSQLQPDNFNITGTFVISYYLTRSSYKNVKKCYFIFYFSVFSTESAERCIIDKKKKNPVTRVYVLLPIVCSLENKKIVPV